MGLQWDEASKRKKAWCLPTVVGGRGQGDGSRMREVLGAVVLLADHDDGGKKKSGKNIAQAVVGQLLDFLYPDGPPSDQAAADTSFYRDLFSVTFLLSDFTASNSGKGKGAGVIIARSVEELSGHILIFHGPCVSHVAHNECGEVSKSFGGCEWQPISRRKKKLDVDGTPCYLVAMVPAILDDLAYIMDRFPDLVPHLSWQEGRRYLGMPAVGVNTRWAYYVDSVKWFEQMGRATPLPDMSDDPMQDDGGDQFAGTCTGRLDRVVNYIIDRSDKREYTPRPNESELAAEINTIANGEVRELLHELSKPNVRLGLAIFELYGTGGGDTDEDDEGNDENDDGTGVEDDSGPDDEGNVAYEHSLRRFINFTQDDHEGVIFRVHRRVRARLKHLFTLASEDEDDGGKYYRRACRRLIEYVESSDGAFDDIDLREMVRSTFSKAHTFFKGGIEGFDSSPGTKFLFDHPVYLSAGMLDEGGDGVLTAKELVHLADGQDPMLIFPTILAASMHKGITATMVSEAIKKHPDSPTHIFLPDM